jgi:signal transduction histidine kinase
MPEVPARIDGLTIKAALLVGFGLMLALWLVAGIEVSRQIEEAQRDEAAVAARYADAQELISSVRSQVLMTSVAVRDALLERDPLVVAGERQKIADAYRSIYGSLERYAPMLDAESERERMGRLRSEIAALEAVSNETFAVIAGRPADAEAAVRGKLIPGRDAVLGVSEEVQNLNRVAFLEQRRATEVMRGSLQRRVWRGFGLALALNLAISMVAFLYSVRLERRLRQQRAREAQIAADLQQLSKRLVRAQDEEQRRIARELHDEVGQALTAVSVALTVAQQRAGIAGADGALLAEARAATDGAVRCLRDLSQLLHPPVLEDFGIAIAVRSYVSEFARRHGIVATCEDDGLDVRLDPDTERSAYRIVQEALTNVARHAHARSVRVQIHLRGGILRVAVDDDGTGFDPADAERPGERRGLGLLGMRERASHLGGTLHLESRVGHGTRLTVTLPAGPAAVLVATDEARPMISPAAAASEAVGG